MSEVIDKPAVAAAAPTKRREVVLVESRLGLAEHKRQEWVVDAEEGVSVEDVLDPMYWAHVAGKFNIHDRVEVRQETGEWILELIIVGVGKNWARMFVAAAHELSKTVAEAPRVAIKHKVEYKGAHKKHCVIRLADSALLQEGFATKALAEEWLANHERVTL